MTKKKTKKKPKRHIRKSLVVIFILLLVAIASLLFVPRYLINERIKDLGYSDAEVEAIREQDLTELILTTKSYSPYLAKAIREHNLNTDYLSLYINVKNDRKLTADDFLLYDRLRDIGYETDQLQNLFGTLDFKEITPLLVYTFQFNEQTYIDDVVANRETSSTGTFTLSHSYRDDYDSPIMIETPVTTSLVNKKYMLREDYIPEGLTSISSEYAVEGMQLKQEAADAFLKFAQAGYNASVPIYAINAYVSAQDQNTAYQNAVTWYGETAADIYAARVGASEHQSGLAVNIAVVGEDNTDYSTTNAYQWTSQNCINYGFIQRYPQGKEAITGFSFEPSHYRYVGTETAKQVSESGLTYDEFYCLYLASWTDESLKPAQDILKQVYPTKKAA